MNIKDKEKLGVGLLIVIFVLFCIKKYQGFQNDKLYQQYVNKVPFTIETVDKVKYNLNPANSTDVTCVYVAIKDSKKADYKKVVIDNSK